MLQKVNCSIYAAMVLRVVTEFRAKGRDSVLLYEKGYPDERVLVISRTKLPTRYGKTPTHFDSPWTDDFADSAFHEVCMPVPLMIYCRR
jgi:hypothetical protein